MAESNRRVRSWLFVRNNYDSAELDKWIKTDERRASQMKYWCVGEEKAPTTGTAHFHLYVHFNNKYSFAAVKKFVGDGYHIEACKGTPEQNRAYVFKEDPNAREFGEIPRKGARNDISKVREMALAGKRVSEIMKEVDSYQAWKAAEMMVKYMGPKRGTLKGVYWNWGPSGCGKTTQALQDALDFGYDESDIWVHNDDDGYFFNGYDGQRVMIFDDFRPGVVSFRKLLLLLNKNLWFTCNTKGGSVPCRAERIWFTCPKTPEDSYVRLAAREEIAQLLRRIDIITEFSELHDENLRSGQVLPQT